MSADQVRFVGGQIVFGENETRWQFPDVEDELLTQAVWKLRYDKDRLTQTDCFRAASLCNAVQYLLLDCPTTELAIQKLRAIRRALTERE